MAKVSFDERVEEFLFSLLPKPAQDRVIAISEKGEEMRALSAVGVDRRNHAYGVLQAAQSRLSRLEKEYPEALDSISEARDVVATAQAEYERLVAALESRSEASRLIRHTDDIVFSYLEKLSNQVGMRGENGSLSIELVETPAKDRFSASEAARIVDELRADLHGVQSAPIPSKVAKAIAKRKVEALAEAGRPNLVGTIEEGVPPVWSNIGYAMMENRDSGEVFFTVQTAGTANAEGGEIPVTTVGKGNIKGIAIPALAIAAWMDPGKMLKALEAEIDAVADDANALDDTTRSKRITELNARILEAQRAEVAAIDRERGDFSYREGTDPQAILGIAVTGGREGNR
ncbi:MAG: hypothetical protein K8H74_10665 [Notoacmeibacter sp.]|nr:hypothetical protein [Notoacmeibacter sp.]